MERWDRWRWPVLVGLAVVGCTAVTCQPSTVIVAKKEERARVENVSGGLYRTTETGRLEPVLTPGIVREYWIESRGGDWYRVTPEQFQAADIDRPMEMCR